MPGWETPEASKQLRKNLTERQMQCGVMVRQPNCRRQGSGSPRLAVMSTKWANPSTDGAGH